MPDVPAPYSHVQQLGNAEVFVNGTLYHLCKTSLLYLLLLTS